MRNTLIGNPLPELGIGFRPNIPGAMVDKAHYVNGLFFTGGSTGGTSNVKGSWTEVTAGLDFDCDGLYWQQNTQSTSSDWLFDIGIGGAGSEVVLVANILESHGSTAYQMNNKWIPIFIPRKTRIAVRNQATSGVVASAIWWSAHRSRRSFKCRRAETWGAVTGDSGGTSIDPGATPNTKGAYVQLTAATSFRVRELLVLLGNQRNSSRATYDFLYDIAVGAASSEQVLLADLRAFTHGTGDFLHPMHHGPYSVDIPAGSRISCRAQCSGADATDRLTDIVAYGFG